jgi:general stress protein 26
MSGKNLKEKILDVLTSGAPKPKLASLATTADGKPYVRMMVVSNRDLTLYSATFLASKKIDHIKKNENVSLCVMADSGNMMSDYVTIEAAASVLTDEKTKKEFWHDYLMQHFKGPEDPNYCVLKYVPKKIELMSSTESEPQILNL